MGGCFPGYDITIPFSWGATAGRNPADMGPWCRYEDINPGSYDPVARVREMEEDGVDAELIFGSNNPRTFVAGHEDADLHHEMIRAYNDFMSEFCATAPGRLGGTALLPNRGTEGCLKEIERVSSMPGFVAFLMQRYPNGELSIEPEDDAVWEAIEASGMPLTIHVGLVDGTMRARQPASALPGHRPLLRRAETDAAVHLRRRPRPIPQAPHPVHRGRLRLDPVLREPVR